MELNRIYNENCIYTMKRMPDNFIDLTVTSPPYDNLREYKGYSFDFESIAKELYRVTKIGGGIIWVVGDAVINGSESGSSFKQALYFMELGFLLHDTMIYEKSGCPFPESNRYNQKFEYMFVLMKGKPKTYNLLQQRTLYSREQIGKSRSSTTRNSDGTMDKMGYETNKEFTTRYNIWEYAVGNGKSTLDKSAFKHPATFPEQLAADHIHSWSNEGDLVYDPFTGSGTTLKMAHLQKRNWVGSEISSEYSDLAAKRIAPYLTVQTMF